MDGVDPGSIRDPYGRVIHWRGRVFRALNDAGAQQDALLRDSGLIGRLEAEKLLIPSHPAGPMDGVDLPPGGRLLEHPSLPVITYPWEWSFSALRAAALHHLDLQLAALAEGVTLTDASACNVQFVGTTPIFIDVTSLRPREPDEYWRGYRQFREQFLNPLLVQAYGGLPFNPLYTGSLAGIDAAYVRRLLRLRDRVKPMIFLHVTLPAMLARRGEMTARGKGGLSAASFGEMLRQLRRWIARLEPRWPAGSWAGYTATAPYNETETAAKRAIVARAMERWRPERLLDLGCNDGALALAAWRAGAGLIVGIDSDAQSVDSAFRQAREAQAPLLPLVVDLADPSPARGWRGGERRGLIERVRPDAVTALALAHHVALSGIPLASFLDWVVEIAPRGIVEFVPPQDPMLAGMLESRRMTLNGYDREIFLERLGALARIEHCETVTGSGRLLAIYDRS
jgi:ribosomal protein L11 methylase PrmA